MSYEFVCLPSEEDISELRGMEFKYVLCGDLIDAYVAQADRRKGITIMGSLPDSYEEYDGRDVILQCCSCQDVNNDVYISILNNYRDAILSGVFHVPSHDSGDQEYMSKICPFTK